MAHPFQIAETVQGSACISIVRRGAIIAIIFEMQTRTKLLAIAREPPPRYYLSIRNTLAGDWDTERN